MEITLLQNNGLRIKGKHSLIGIDPSDKPNYNGIILLSKKMNDLEKTPEFPVVFEGPGEYEVGGVKITGTKIEDQTVYSMIVDGVDILVGNVKALDKLQHKLKEHNIVITLCEEVIPASFLTTLAVNVMLFYGDAGAEVTKSFGEANITTMQKYTTTMDKLPNEVETVLLQ